MILYIWMCCFLFLKYLSFGKIDLGHVLEPEQIFILKFYLFPKRQTFENTYSKYCILQIVTVEQAVSSGASSESIPVRCLRV